VVKIVKENDQILIFVADRGQGIVSSLSSSAGIGLSGQQVLKKAFEEKISGRSPEKRGNGLKFVMNYIRTLNHALFCFSQNEVYFYGDHFKSLDTAKLPKEFGTLVCICWSIK
jgi:sensor histidine kinase regulating citrate/malate metabolism